MLEKLFYMALGALITGIIKKIRDRTQVQMRLSLAFEPARGYSVLEVTNVGHSTIPAFEVCFSSQVSCYFFEPKVSPVLLPTQKVVFRCLILVNDEFRNPFGFAGDPKETIGLLNSPRISLILTNSNQLLESSDTLALEFLKHLQAFATLPKYQAVKACSVDPTHCFYRSPTLSAYFKHLIETNGFSPPSTAQFSLIVLLLVLFALMQIFPAH